MALENVLLILSMAILCSASQYENRPCVAHDECGKLRVCRNKVCQKIKYVGELLMKTALNDNADKECQLSSECPDMFYCNQETRTCEKVTQVQQIVEKQNCNHKSFCTRDDQCKCGSEEMVCRQNECVYAKLNKHKSKEGASCLSHQDCPSAFVCERQVCREIRTPEELSSISLIKSCIRNDDCRLDETCEDGSCKVLKNEIKPWTPTKAAVSKCSTHSDCPAAFICAADKCREAVTLEELLLKSGLTQMCLADSDCQEHEFCSQGECKEKPKITNVQTIKCLMITLGSTCRRSADCQSCGTDLVNLTCLNGKCSGLAGVFTKRKV